MPIAVTGHSLGGALATLAAYELNAVGLEGLKGELIGLEGSSGESIVVDETDATDADGDGGGFSTLTQ